MNYKPVAKSKLHQRLNRQMRLNLSPDERGFVETPCRILRVWDWEAELDGPIPEQIKSRLDEVPGLILCEVATLDNKVFTLPLDELPDQIYATYGNALLMQGRLAKIRHRNHDLQTGTVIPIRSVFVKNSNPSTASEVADIGAIIGI